MGEDDQPQVKYFLLSKEYLSKNTYKQPINNPGCPILRRWVSSEGRLCCMGVEKLIFDRLGLQRRLVLEDAMAPEHYKIYSQPFAKSTPPNENTNFYGMHRCVFSSDTWCRKFDPFKQKALFLRHALM